MDVEHASATVIATLKEIQADSGFPTADINSGTYPLDLEGFDSKIWPVATGMIAEALHIDIPTDRNVFVSSGSKPRRLNVSEIVTVICELAPVGARTK